MLPVTMVEMVIEFVAVTFETEPIVPLFEPPDHTIEVTVETEISEGKTM